MNNREKAILKLVKIGLDYSVDYIYILQDIESLLYMDKKQIDIDKIKVENYLDY